MPTDNFSALEPHFLCDVCSIAVTNPLCPKCLATEIEAWLTLYPDLKKQILPRLRSYLNRIEDRIMDSTQCIKCGDMTASVCPYCFTDHMLMELKKIEASAIILKEFFEFFNFDFDHSGYSKEAEELEIL